MKFVVYANYAKTSSIQWDITRVGEMARDNKLCEWSSV